MRKGSRYPQFYKREATQDEWTPITEEALIQGLVREPKKSLDDLDIRSWGVVIDSPTTSYKIVWRG